MAGVPGAGGPVPKRANERRRRNKSSQPTDSVEITGEVEIPEPDEDWHPIARRWFEALASSGQSSFYEPSDWATAALIAESMSRDLNPQVVGVTETGEVVKDVIPLKGASLSAYLKAMTALLITEGDRRRARMEIERNAEEPELTPVMSLDEKRERVRSGKAV